MSVKYVVHETVRAVKQHAARRWLRGIGKDAEFEDNSVGWYVTVGDLSVFVGEQEPELRAGDRVRLTVERE